MVFIMLEGTAKVGLMLFPNPGGLNLSIGVTPLSQYKPTGQAPAIKTVEPTPAVTAP